MVSICAGLAARYQAAALALSSRGSEIGDRFGDADLMWLARADQARALLHLGRTSEGRRLVDEALVVTESGVLSPVVRGIVYCNTIAFCRDMYELDHARAWTEALAGRGLEGRRDVDLAMRLSPLDPLYYGMLGTRAFTHMTMSEDNEAASWPERAARAPGAHVLIAMIAVAAHALNGDETKAKSWAANVRERNDSLTQQDFFRSARCRDSPQTDFLFSNGNKKNHTT